MFGLFKKTGRPEFFEIRELFFGDAPLSKWKPADDRKHADGEAEIVEPWHSFEFAREALEQHDSIIAANALRRVLEIPNLESRHYLQAWHFLRQIGTQPNAEDAKRVLGVVLEVHLDNGLDTLAAYADHTARYINHGGRLLIWEGMDSGISSLIETMLLAGKRVADAIGPWEHARRPPPEKHSVRINILTVSGLHFGEGPLDTLSDDPMGGPVIDAGAELMKALIDRAQSAPA
jgi:hypothetical protein